MSTFDAGLLQSEAGQIDAIIFENEHIGIPESLFFKFHVPLKQFEFNGEIINTDIVMEFVSLNIHHLREIENRTFEFPLNPEEGYIDASIYLENVHNPVDVKSVSFGKFGGNVVEAKFCFNIDFEFEQTGISNIYDHELNAPLTFGVLYYDKEMNSTNHPEYVSKFLSLENSDFEVTENHVIFKLY